MAAFWDASCAAVVVQSTMATLDLPLVSHVNIRSRALLADKPTLYPAIATLNLEDLATVQGVGTGITRHKQLPCPTSVFADESITRNHIHNPFTSGTTASARVVLTMEIFWPISTA